MSFAEAAKQLALDALSLGIAALIRKFVDDEPDAATKVKAAADLAQKALDLMPEEQLHGDLTDEAAARAELAYALAKMVALRGGG